MSGAVRVLRVIEYRYRDVAAMTKDMARWTLHRGDERSDVMMRSAVMMPVADESKFSPRLGGSSSTVGTTAAEALEGAEGFMGAFTPVVELTIAHDDRDLSWVEDVKTVDAISTDEVDALRASSSWQLIATGTGAGGQTTLTFGWPAPSRR